MPLEVIGAGFGRTGTKSLHIALEKIGLSCYHMTELIQNLDHMDFWLEAHRKGGHVDWEKLFDKYKATVDWPGCVYWKELMDAYPNAKVVLSVRDPDKWYDSVKESIYTFTKVPRDKLEKNRDTLKHHEFVNETIWGPNGTFRGHFEDREYAKKVFLDHIEAVKQAVPKEKLLVFEVTQGWEPLCNFLGVPVPHEPFPKANERAILQNVFRNIMEGKPVEPLTKVQFVKT